MARGRQAERLTARGAGGAPMRRDALYIYAVPREHLEISRIMEIGVLRRLENGIHHVLAQNR